MKYVFTLLVCLGSLSLFTQTSEEQKKITNSYNHEANKGILSYLNNEYEEKKKRIKIFLDNLTEQEKSRIDIPNLVDVTLNGIPLYHRSHNNNSAVTIRANQLHTGGSLGLDLNGQNMIAGVWEAENGYPLTTHLDLSGRITIIDGGSNVNFHATHVTGTIISSGDNISLNLGRGIAYQASVLAANSNNDSAEMASRASLGLLVSNHSYGFNADGLPLWFFGAYTSDAFNVDLITVNNPYYLPVISAGNDRNNVPSANPTKGGYDLLTGQSVAKNGITSAAVNQVLNYNSASDVVMSTFSNWGPTDDGRIKPDISSKGVGVLSTSNTSNTAYGSSNGTSMSAPAISGLLLLLQQHYNNVNGNFMLASTAKGLLLHTADEAGTFQGPDYRFGWGLANGLKSAETITNNGISSYILETTLNNSETTVLDVIALGTEPLMVSISWTDPQGTSVNNVLDDLNPDLVNDLDIKLTSNFTDYYPWKLNVASPNSAATRNSTNDVDNFEKVEVDSPSNNEEFTVTINHKGTLSGGQQNYSLIITGGIPSNLSVTDYSLSSSLQIYPNPSNGVFTVKFKSNSNNSHNNIKVDVYDLQGRLIYKKKFINTSSIFNQKINLENVKSGVYIVNIYEGNRTTSRKLIIE